MTSEYEMTVTYNKGGTDIAEVTGNFTIAEGPFGHFWVLNTKKGYVGIAYDRIISISCPRIPPAMLIPLKHLEMSREIQETQFVKDYHFSKNSPEENLS